MKSKYPIEKIAFEKGYFVNESGEVFSPSNKKLKLKIYNKFYYSFNIKHLGISKRVKVHRLQAYQKFKDKIYDDKIVIRHLNGNSFDNSFCNIDIGTYKDNSLDIPIENRIKLARNASKSVIKYDAQTVIDIRSFYSNCKSYKQTCEKYMISKSSLHYILHKDISWY